MACMGRHRMHTCGKDETDRAAAVAAAKAATEAEAAGTGAAAEKQRKKAEQEVRYQAEAAMEEAEHGAAEQEPADPACRMSSWRRLKLRAGTVGLSNRSVRAPPVQQHTARDMSHVDVAGRIRSRRTRVLSLTTHNGDGRRREHDCFWICIVQVRPPSARLCAFFCVFRPTITGLFGGHTSRTTKSCASACQCLRHTPSLAFASRPAEGTTARLAGGRSIVSPRSRDTAVTRWVTDPR